MTHITTPAMLDGRRAIVTGASRNLGAEVAFALARHGAKVAINYRGSAAEAEAVLTTLEEYGPGHVAVEGDVSSSAEVTSMIDSAATWLGGLDVVVNNAGPYGATPIMEADDSEWERVVDANLKGTWLCTKAAIPHLRASTDGRVVNLSAVSARVRNRGAYGLAKDAVEVLTEELALELAPYATVNAVAPGQVAESLDELSSYDQQWAQAVRDRTPRGRLVTRAELAEAVAVICTAAFSSMTGTVLRFDGGLGLNRF
ncbi:MAG TPA: SDR family NAD(P)-dependent oxidoreductase [Acidimicrobiia bacterium]|nr:SDR family NAD(P)-dependent oxidoreductase [Acidimicrobiia bacterium]